MDTIGTDRTPMRRRTRVLARTMVALVAGAGLSLAIAAPAEAVTVTTPPNCTGTLDHSNGSWKVHCYGNGPSRYRAIEQCRDDFHDSTFYAYGAWVNKPATSTSSCGPRYSVLKVGVQY